jgi:hypothetical protein
MISDPGSSPLRNPHPFTGSETLEPTPLPDRSPTDLPGVGSNTHPPTTISFGWPGDSERSATGPLRRFGRRQGTPGRKGQPSRPPFDRLKFWRVEHELTHRLMPYQATDVSLMFRQATWGTILYWSQLLDGIELEEPVKV